MRVYTAHRKYDYEGFDIIGVFTTREVANECCARDVNKRGQPYGDSYDVVGHELQDT